VSDVQSWLAHSLSSVFGVAYEEAKRGNNPGICASLQNFWNTDGRTLSSFTEEEFRRRDAVNGDKLFASLELWKMLQWRDVPSAVSQGSLLGSHSDLDIASIVMGSPCPSIDATSSVGSPADLQMGPASVVDINLLSERCIPDTFPASKFSNPSSVDASSKNSDGRHHARKSIYV
jgi:hypothetical protein